MDAELKAKWVAALRSGEFQQGREKLHDSGAYCCLGVLCKIAGADMSRSHQECVDDLGDETTLVTTAWLDAATYTEEEELGTRLLHHFNIGSKVEMQLITMNDNEGADFEQIAAWVETHDLKTGQPLEPAAPVGAP